MWEAEETVLPDTSTGAHSTLIPLTVAPRRFAPGFAGPKVPLSYVAFADLN